ncbi:hypothetical protein BJ508DRAFT_329860 [Ascobolus immersus RN42]|uniref:Uncharacterized protein n=1 Tax=Ascobolus immersus RN42 TaxID=1160509 RepID=A0A3N4I0W9_ASCIM|nr:hypothetical protein BJ508DRAFT_329860 [Ascobolus immersus RN42]
MLKEKERRVKRPTKLCISATPQQLLQTTHLCLLENHQSLDLFLEKPFQYLPLLQVHCLTTFLYLSIFWCYPFHRPLFQPQTSKSLLPTISTAPTTTTTPQPPVRPGTPPLPRVVELPAAGDAAVPWRVVYANCQREWAKCEGWLNYVNSLDASRPKDCSRSEWLLEKGVSLRRLEKAFKDVELSWRFFRDRPATEARLSCYENILARMQEVVRLYTLHFESSTRPIWRLRGSNELPPVFKEIGEDTHWTIPDTTQVVASVNSRNIRIPIPAYGLAAVGQQPPVYQLTQTPVPAQDAATVVPGVPLHTNIPVNPVLPNAGPGLNVAPVYTPLPRLSREMQELRASLDLTHPSAG